MDCLGMDSVMSTFDRRHPMHMLASFGSITIPHEQHKLHEKIVSLEQVSNGGHFSEPILILTFEQKITED